MNLTYARIKDPDPEKDAIHQRLDRFKKFVVKCDGAVVGQIKHSYRPKNAGGSAWEFQTPNKMGMTVSIFEPTLEKLLVEARRVLEEIAVDPYDPNEYMGFRIGEHVVYRDEEMFFIVGFHRSDEVIYLARERGGASCVEAHFTDLN